MTGRRILLCVSILGIILLGCERNVSTIDNFEKNTTTDKVEETESQTMVKEYETIARSDEQSELVSTYIENIVAPECAEIYEN